MLGMYIFFKLTYDDVLSRIPSINYAESQNFFFLSQNSAGVKSLKYDVKMFRYNQCYSLGIINCGTDCTAAKPSPL